jgi:hypothetical protein
MKISFAASALSLALLSGCFFGGPTQSDGTGAGAAQGGSQDADTAALAKLRTDLETHRTEAMGKSAMELESVGSTLYYRTYPGFDPIFHRRNADGTTLDYGFSIGSGDNANDRTSEDLVVTAERAGDHVSYHAYDAHAKSAQKGVADLPAPTDEQKWWAYAVSGSTVYMITTPTEKTGMGNTIWSYSPGGTPTKLFTLEDAGIMVGELLDFDVDGNTLMVIESGRLWRVDLASKKAQYLKNKTEIAGAVNFSKDGVAFEDSTGLKFFDYATNELRDLALEIQKTSYQIAPTYKTAHYFTSATTSNNFTRYKSWIVYTGSMGIFAYDIVQKRVAPVLLDVSTENLRVAYRYPIVTDDGAAYLVGLTSTDGAVGADGPVYRTSLAEVLPH